MMPSPLHTNLISVRRFRSQGTSFITDDVATNYTESRNRYKINITVSEMLGHKRTRDIMLPRQVAMYLCKNGLNLSLKRIADFFDGRDHTSVIHAVKKLEGDIKRDPVLKKDLKQLQKELGVIV